MVGITIAAIRLGAFQSFERGREAAVSCACHANTTFMIAPFRTPARGRPDRSQCGPDRRSADETQANSAGVFWPCEKPPVKAWTAPPRRVNFSFTIHHTHPR